MNENNREYLLLQSHLINALLPKFLKHTFYNLIFFISLYPIYWLINSMVDFPYDFGVILSIIFLTLFFSFCKIFWDLVKIKSTSYKFYAHHLEEHFQLIKEETHSINYSQITDIQIRKNLWDRVCKVGDIIIHTGNDEYHNTEDKALVLRDIKNPNILKLQIEQRIHLGK